MQQSTSSDACFLVTAQGAPGGAAPPYCASIALDGGGGGGGGGVATGERIRVPLRGELVLVLSNPEATPLHTFRVPYDLGGPLAQAEAADAAAPYAPAAAAKAYVRQRVFAVPRNGPPHAIGCAPLACLLASCATCMHSSPDDDVAVTDA